MKKNLDTNVVVLDKDIYARLLSLASIGAYEISREPEFKDLARHARKFNPDLQPAHAEYVEKQEQDRAFARLQYFRARRIVSRRNGIHYGRDENSQVTLEKYQREFYYLTHDNQAYPIHVLGFAPNYGKSGVKIEFIDPKHKAMANQYSAEVVAKNIAETAEEIPVNFKRHYAHVDLRTENECCADPQKDEEEVCGSCGDCKDGACNSDPELQSCCENEDRNNWGGGCKNCGDPCL